MTEALISEDLLDILAGDRRFGPTSRAALDRCLQEGSVVACAAVWAEVTAAYDDPNEGLRVLDHIVVADSGYVSFLERGLVPPPAPPS